MKSKLMRIIASLIALTVFLCCLTACGKKDSEEEITKKSGEIEVPPTESLVALTIIPFRRKARTRANLHLKIRQARHLLCKVQTAMR